ncbi:MAG: hypothetical protein KA155_09690 [Alphaproteobacteria bacterium]|jgi:hypothetical protein|nr:hypothetical protein [Alphaproteobacteria bacterium]
MIQSNKRHVVRSDRPAPPAPTPNSDAQLATAETHTPKPHVNMTRENDKKFFASLGKPGKHRPKPENKEPLQLVPTLHGGGFVSAGLPEPDPFQDLSEAERKIVEAAFAAFSNRKAPALKTAKENVTAENVEVVETQEATAQAQSLTVKINEVANPAASKKGRGPSKKKKPAIVVAGEEGDELNIEEIVAIEHDHENVREVLGSGFDPGADDYDHRM